MILINIFSRIICGESPVEDLGGQGERDFFLQLVYVGLLHFCNFSALNYFVKSIIASACALTVLFLYSPLTCYITATSSFPNNCNTEKIFQNLSRSGEHNATNTSVSDLFPTSNNTNLNCSNLLDAPYNTESVSGVLFGETVLSILMLLGLVWMLNREFEKAYRVTFHCSRLSTKDRRQILNLKNQADWLLHNIIPKHVHESLKRYVLEICTHAHAHAYI